MTRDTGQVTTTQATLGGLLIALVATSLVAGLGLLIRGGEQAPPLEAPARPAVEEPCPGAASPPRLPRPSAPAPISASALIECPSAFDGMLVTYRGEVVRAVLHRGERAWVHLNDDRYALELGPLPDHRTTVGGNSGIPVSIPIEVAREISHVGNARHQGDIIAVVGIFRRTDPADGGGPTVQAQQARIERVGRPLPEHVHRARPAVAILLSLSAAFAALRVRTAARR